MKYSNPYHNNLHAADVTQTVHYMLWVTGLAVSGGALGAHKLISASTAMAHRLGSVRHSHCGHHSRLSAHGHYEQLSHHVWVIECTVRRAIHYSLTCASSEITLMYNDRSVLENYHISEAFKVLRKDDSNIVVNLSREEYR